MRIAVISDIHDNIWTLYAALGAVADTDLLICCGDLCSPFIVTLMAENFHRPIYVVQGNNDGDLFRMSRNAGRYPHFHLEGELFQAEFGGKRFIVNHFDNIASEIARGSSHDVVCFGHNHDYQVEKFGEVQLINPGTLMGYNPIARKEVPPTFVIYDTLSERVASYQVAFPVKGSQELAVTAFP
jgi:uncharacterized protein